MQIAAVFKGGAFHPFRRHREALAAQYGEGEVLFLEIVEERSEKSHSHEFAWLKEAWQNLPETIADQFPTPNHLRKRALILGGFYHETLIDAGSNAAALRVAAYARGKDEFAHVVVRGAFVVERTAKSQSRRSMDKAEFQASKQAVIDVVSAMIGVTPAALLQNAGKAA
jgi:hypothetical protein